MKVSSIDVIQLACPLAEEAYDVTARWSDFTLVLVESLETNRDSGSIRELSI